MSKRIGPISPGTRYRMLVELHSGSFWAPRLPLRHVDQALALEPSLQDAVNNRAAIAAAAAAKSETTPGG